MNERLDPAGTGNESSLADTPGGNADVVAGEISAVEVQLSPCPALQVVGWGKRFDLGCSHAAQRRVAALILTLITEIAPDFKGFSAASLLRQQGGQLKAGAWVGIVTSRDIAEHHDSCEGVTRALQGGRFFDDQLRRHLALPL